MNFKMCQLQFKNLIHSSMQIKSGANFIDYERETQIQTETNNGMVFFLKKPILFISCQYNCLITVIRFLLASEHTILS